MYVWLFDPCPVSGVGVMSAGVVVGVRIGEANGVWVGAFGVGVGWVGVGVGVGDAWKMALAGLDWGPVTPELSVTVTVMVNEAGAFGAKVNVEAVSPPCGAPLTYHW